MKFAIELPTWLGDCVMASPAVKNIVQLFPDSELIFIGSKVSISLMKNHPNCIKIIPLERNLIKIFLFSKEIPSVDIFISFRSSKRSHFLSKLIKSSKSFIYDKKKFVTGHQVEKYVNFVNFYLNTNLQPGNLKIYASNGNKDYKYKKYIGISPGSSYGSAKCWLPEKYVELIEVLSKKRNILLLGGDSELSLISDIELESRKRGVSNIVNLAGKTSISMLSDYISHLDLFITGDSGPMHIAAAFKVPTLCIFGPTKFFETSQWMNEKSVIIKKNLDCQPCMRRICPLKHHNCMQLIESNEVIVAAEKLLR